MIRVLKITSGLMGVLLLVMVGVMGMGRYGKEGPRLMLFTYLDGEQPMLGWMTTDFRHMRPLGDLCTTHWYPTGIERPDENWLYVGDCSQQSNFGWSVKRIHVVSGVENVIAVRMVPYGGRWSPDNRWFVYQERKNAHDKDDYEVEWVRVAPDGSQRVVLTENIPVTFWYAEESYASFLKDTDWLQIFRHVWFDPHDEDEDIYRIRIDGKAWVNLTANVDDLTAWLHAKASGLQTNLTQDILKTAIKESATRFSNLPACKPGDANWIVVELPTKQLRVISDGLSLRGISMLDGSVLWEVPNRDRVWTSPNEEWVLLGGEYTVVYEIMRWDGSNRRPVDHWVQISDFWSPDLKWLVYLGWDKDIGGYTINRMELESGTTEILFKPAAALIAKSPDGQWFYFSVSDYQTNTFAFYTMRFDGSDLTRIKVLDSYRVDHIERFIGPINRYWHPLILTAIALTLILTPIFISPLRRRFRPN